MNFIVRLLETTLVVSDHSERARSSTRHSCRPRTMPICELGYEHVTSVLLVLADSSEGGRGVER